MNTEHQNIPFSWKMRILDFLKKIALYSRILEDVCGKVVLVSEPGYYNPYKRSTTQNMDILKTVYTIQMKDTLLNL